MSYTGPERRFTPREEVVLEGLCRGLAPKTIALECHLSVSTIRWYIQEMKGKLPDEYQRYAPTKGIVLWAFKSGRCW